MSSESPVQRAAPETFRARVLTASLTVKDIEKSLAWYRDIVGFYVDRKYERDGKVLAVILKAGTVEIVIDQDDGAKGWDRVKGQGMSLQFRTAQDIDQMAERIKQRSGQLALEPTDMPWGARVFRLVDPDGFQLVISSDAPEAK